MGRSAARLRAEMTHYTVVFSRTAQRAISQLDSNMQRRVDGAIRVLSIDPYPPNSRPIKGSNKYRLRAGDYRIVYEVQHNVLTILIFDIGHRRDIYRNI